MCQVFTYAYTYVASGHVYGCEFPSERFNFSTIASPSTIDALLRTKKKVLAYVRRLYTCSDPSLFHISPRQNETWKNEQMINEKRLMTIPLDTCRAIYVAEFQTDIIDCSIQYCSINAVYPILIQYSISYFFKILRSLFKKMSRDHPLRLSYLNYNLQKGFASM